MSDWVSTYSVRGRTSTASILEMPSCAVHEPARPAAPPRETARCPSRPLDDKVRRILRVALRMRWDKRPQKDGSIPSTIRRTPPPRSRWRVRARSCSRTETNALPLAKAPSARPRRRPERRSGGHRRRRQRLHDAVPLGERPGGAPATRSGGDDDRLHARLRQPDASPPRRRIGRLPDGSPGASRAEYFAGTELQGQSRA